MLFSLPLRAFTSSVISPLFCSRTASRAPLAPNWAVTSTLESLKPSAVAICCSSLATSPAAPFCWAVRLRASARVPSLLNKELAIVALSITVDVTPPWPVPIAAASTKRLATSFGVYSPPDKAAADMLVPSCAASVIPSEAAFLVTAVESSLAKPV